MTEKRFIVIDDGFDFKVRDTFTGDDLIDADGVADVLNDYEEENNQLKQFPVKLENRIQKLQEDLQKLIEMDTTDLNTQAVQDVATVISISLNALIEFKKELGE